MRGLSGSLELIPFNFIPAVCVNRCPVDYMQNWNCSPHLAILDCVKTRRKGLKRQQSVTFTEAGQNITSRAYTRETYGT